MASQSALLETEIGSGQTRFSKTHSSPLCHLQLTAHQSSPNRPADKCCFVGCTGVQVACIFIARVGNLLVEQIPRSAFASTEPERVYF
jgi:hypothetical protein